MPTFTSHSPGTPSWADLMSPDIDASKAFYTSVFGWDAEDQYDDDGNLIYVMFRLGGKAVAGLGGQGPGMDGMPPVWNTYMTVEDLDASVAKVAPAGGTIIMPPMDVMTSGKMAVMTDPSGAAFSMWQPADHIGAEVCNEPNAMMWNELMSRDLDAAKPFYAAVLDWEMVDAEDMEGYTLVTGAEMPRAGMMAMPDEVPGEVPSHWALYFGIENADDAAAKVTAAGGTVLNRMSVPTVGDMVVCHDPAGGYFTLMQPEQPS